VEISKQSAFLGHESPHRRPHPRNLHRHVLITPRVQRLIFDHRSYRRARKQKQFSAALLPARLKKAIDS
jgi:hypothetical protein